MSQLQILQLNFDGTYYLDSDWYTVPLGTGQISLGNNQFLISEWFQVVPISSSGAQ